MNNRFLQSIVACLFLLLLLANPLSAQEIMSYEDFQERDFDEPYVFHLNSDSGELLYFGSRHSFNPDDPQFDKLSEEFMNFSPDMVYTESFPEDVSSLSMNTDSNQYRDQYHASLIVDAVKDGKRVFCYNWFCSRSNAGTCTTSTA